jgi:hypothetical protein
MHIRAPVPFAMPCHATAWPGPVSAHVCFFLSPLLHTFACASMTTHYLSWLHCSSGSNVGLKSFFHQCMNVSLIFIRNFIWAKPNNSNNLPPYLKVSSMLFPHALLFVLVFSALANNRVYKIARFQFWVGLTNTNTMSYPGSSPSIEVIALRPAVWYWWK